MAQHNEDRPIDEAVERLKTNGFDGLADAVTVLLNSAMMAERSEPLGAGLCGRSSDRRGYANGYKGKSLKTRLGTLQLSVPQTRDGELYPQSLTRGLRSERALLLAIAERYVQGVSTRRVKKIVEELCGMDVSSTQVSRAAAELDGMLEAWRSRDLGCYRYLILDAQYEKVRQTGQVLDAAVPIACGVDDSGHRDILGGSVSLSEAEVHWRGFLSELKDRGLHGLEMIVSDSHEGLKAARKAVFPSVPWQRGQFHLQQNAGHYVPKMAMRTQVAADIRAIFNAPDQDEAEHLLDQFLKRYEKTAPPLVTWAEEAIPEGFAVFSLPESQRRKLRTTNLVERLNEEIRRRTRVARLFPNEAACLRLVSAILMAISEDWQSAGKRYVVFNKERAI
ncbi:MAG: IS256 family transposase [Gammaproteobacteria bacterium AqS3]|nr:IS256 family transposase [Gammaproteobacteria bacterium AqS3]